MFLYRLLLHLYPASFRGEYGGEMAAIFRRRLRDAGTLARAGLLLGALLEIAVHAAAVHWDILRQDLRYTARTLRRAYGFALTAILICLEWWRTHAAFHRHAFAFNGFVMTGGFLLVGYQLSGYFLATV